MNPVHLEAKEIRLRGPQATWAGEHPPTGGFCLGLEDGTIRIVGRGRPLGIPPIRVVDSGEAINGAAFAPEMTAISTPAEILIHHDAGPPGSSGGWYSYEGGAHGVIATAGGGVIAPIGPAGLLLAEPTDDRGYTLREIRPEDEELYFYRVVRAGLTAAGDEVFACAGRKGGLMALTVAPRGGTSRIIGGRGHDQSSGRTLDIVDVCSLNSAAHPRAVAGLGSGGTIHLTLDILGHKPPINLRFPELRGAGYSILSSQGHLFVLTSQRLCTLPDLAATFLRGGLVGPRIRTLNLSVDAVDASIAYGESLLIIQSESVALIEVSDLTACLNVGPGDRRGTGDSRGASMPEESDFTIQDANVMWSPSPTHALSSFAVA